MNFKNKKILVPFDFSDPSKKAVNTAIEIGGSVNGITVLHVIEPLPVYDVYNDNIAVERIDRANDSLRAAFNDSSFNGMVFDTKVADPPHGITDYASEHKFDLIVMPSHGRTGLKRLFIGSVAERVVRLAHCPVLVLRE